ncbi:MAG TPA: DUF3748 domain-containing protein [Opitutaceae bacterium]|nr:DUF3748 domain-containing protein [Opitutaceae bacterium]
MSPPTPSAPAGSAVPPILDLSRPGAERQLTRARQGHVLTNIAAWSPDSQWIVYDTRPVPDEFTGTRIEQVNVASGAVQLLYETRGGACCGVATYDPSGPRVVFIAGPEPGPGWSYGPTRRRGVLVDTRQPGRISSLDAMNYAPPFQAGALRGGSHVHVFSGDGQWLSFTYDDEVLAKLGNEPDGQHDINQRNLGVAVPAGPVRVARGHPRNHDGDYFSVVVTRTAARPRPGSDEISRACEEGWIGIGGYRRADGTWQRRALAFQGLVTAADGREHAEVFVVDLPDDVTVAGDEPLEGTLVRRPAPPRGAIQRRLTFTAGRKYPGLQGPRHWLRSAPDGSQIAFLMKDDAGVAQLWLVPPAGGAPRQLTRHSSGIASAFTWSPDGRWLAHVMDQSVCLTDAASGQSYRLTPRRPEAEAPLALACILSPDGRWIAYQRPGGPDEGRFPQIWAVQIPAIPLPQP